MAGLVTDVPVDEERVSPSFVESWLIGVAVNTLIGAVLLFGCWLDVVVPS